MIPHCFDFVIYDFIEKELKPYRLDNVFDDLELNAFKDFNKFYYPDVIAVPPTKKLKRDNSLNRTCRFCKKEAPMVSFRKIAHLLPQLMGNKSLIHYNECDKCNERFGVFENSLANFIGIFRTLDKMNGQEGIPTFKSPDKELRIAFQKDIDSFKIEGKKGPVFNENENKFVLKATKQTYTPLHVIKCLYKIGYSILFDKELEEYSPTLKILMSNEFDSLLAQAGHIAKMYRFTFPTTFKNPSIFSFRKRDEYQNEKLPTKIIAIYFGRFMYQFILPNKNDIFLFTADETTTWKLVPPFFYSGKIKPRGNLIDLSKNQATKDDEDAIDIHLNNPFEDNES